MALYCDTSFFLALVFKDKNYSSVAAAWDEHAAKFSSALLKFETLMAIRRVYSEGGNTEAYVNHQNRAKELFLELHLIQIDALIYDELEARPEFTHRTLDAIHLGTMLHLKKKADPGILIGVYDQKLRKLCLEQNLKMI